MYAAYLKGLIISGSQAKSITGSWRKAGKIMRRNGIGHLLGSCHIRKEKSRIIKIAGISSSNLITLDALDEAMKGQ